MCPEEKSNQSFPWLLTGYYLDECDSDIVVLRRQDGSEVAAFSAWGATREGILAAAEEDQRSRVWSAPKPRLPATEAALVRRRHPHSSLKPHNI